MQVFLIVICMLSSRDIFKKYDLSSVRFFFIGVVFFGKEIVEEFLKIYLMWYVGQGYGMIELVIVVCIISEYDIY